MDKEVFILTVFTLLSQVWMLELQESIVAPYATLLQENIASTQLAQQINISMSSILQNMATYNVYIRNVTDQVLAEHQVHLQEKVAMFKSNLKSTQSRSIVSVNGKNIVLRCLIEESKLDVLYQEINNQIKKCATIAMAEMVNVISNSLNEAQTFMTIPQVIGRDVQRCGLSYSCRWDIVGDAISEALQSLALKTVVSVDSCGLQGLRQITETGLGILQDIFACINDEINLQLPGSAS
ncbi:hypothetical protein NQ314_006951 [Rhamnusium bicolor]|uniref:Uncharacterized protein n=1 Tax=Rhamnusium bicolor TaxID=1586634 RepID=A0AAV8YUC3_9CUCU|nr:hypothetical protein NQ314_006951 [Rhamnusium bicolor]